MKEVKMIIPTMQMYLALICKMRKWILKAIIPKHLLTPNVLFPHIFRSILTFDQEGPIVFYKTLKFLFWYFA